MSRTDFFNEPDDAREEFEGLYKKEAYDIITCCFEVHNQLGKGFSEVVYKDALAVELKLNQIPFDRERRFDVIYKGHLLPRHYNCDFLVMDKIVLEIKAQIMLTEADTGQLLNYLKVSERRLGLLINFGENRLKFKRVIL
jgi:GxxExxY protein